MVIGSIKSMDRLSCYSGKGFLCPFNRMAIGAVKKKGFLKLFFCHLVGLIFGGLNRCKYLFNFSLVLFLGKGGLRENLHEEIPPFVQVFLQDFEAERGIVSPRRRRETGSHEVQLFMNGSDLALRSSQKKTSGRQIRQSFLS